MRVYACAQTQPVMPLDEELGVSTLIGVATLDVESLGLSPAALDTVHERQPEWFPVRTEPHAVDPLRCHVVCCGCG